MSKKTSDNKTPTTYIAFLRGVNMIGRKTIKMNELKSIFEAMGFENVKTIQASGNVLFTAITSDTFSLKTKSEKYLENALGYKVSVVLRTLDSLQSLINSKPFGQVKLRPRTKRLLTFLSERHESHLKVPYTSPNKDFAILQIGDNEIYSVVNLLPNKPSSGIMTFLEKEFGKKITTRNWNTIVKIATQ